MNCNCQCCIKQQTSASEVSSPQYQLKSPLNLNFSICLYGTCHQSVFIFDEDAVL